MRNIHVKVVSNQEIAPLCFRMVLSGPFENFHLQPGQFIMLRIGNGYDPLLRRPFAAYTVKTLKGISLEIFYAVVGHGTRIMSRIRPDAELELLGPLGNGFRIPDRTTGALIVAGGMGIVPLRALIYKLLDTQIHSIHLFMGSKSASHLLFHKEFQDNEILLHVSTEDGSNGHHGLITELFSHFLENHPLKKDNNVCFTCGPSSMLQTVASIASRYRLPCQVSLESRMACGIGACLGCAVKLRNHSCSSSSPENYGRVCIDGPVFDAQEVEW